MSERAGCRTDPDRPWPGAGATKSWSVWLVADRGGKIVGGVRYRALESRSARTASGEGGPTLLGLVAPFAWLVSLRVISALSAVGVDGRLEGAIMTAHCRGCFFSLGFAPDRVHGPKRVVARALG